MDVGMEAAEGRRALGSCLHKGEDLHQVGGLVLTHLAGEGAEEIRMGNFVDLE